MYIDQDKVDEVKKEQREMRKEYGFKPKPPKVVDLEYGYVPQNTSQSAKGGSTNVNRAAEMNLKRFDYEK